MSESKLLLYRLNITLQRNKISKCALGLSSRHHNVNQNMIKAEYMPCRTGNVDFAEECFVTFLQLLTNKTKKCTVYCTTSCHVG